MSLIGLIRLSSWGIRNQSVYYYTKCTGTKFWFISSFLAERSLKHVFKAPPTRARIKSELGEFRIFKSLAFWRLESKSAVGRRGSTFALLFSTRCVRTAFLCWIIFVLKSIFISSWSTSYIKNKHIFVISALT